MKKDKPAAKTKNREKAIKAKDKKDKPKKQERPKVVRDSFTMPVSDYEKLTQLKARCLQLGVHVKKGELLRSGLRALENMTDAQLLKMVQAIEKIKTGRPGQKKTVESQPTGPVED